MPPKGTKSNPVSNVTKAKQIQRANESAKKVAEQKRTTASANTSGAAAARNYSAMAKAEQQQKASEAQRRRDAETRNKLASEKRYIQYQKEQKNNKSKKGRKGKGANGNGDGNAGDNEVTLPLPGPPGPGFDLSLPPLPPVRVPDRDNLISLVTPGSNEALLVSVLFEELSAVEIVKFARNDTIDGVNTQYNVISNLAELKSKLDPSYLIAKQRSDTTIDGGFSIRLIDKIPAIDYLFDNNIPNYVYFDPTFGDNGSLIIELENIDVDEIVEVEIDTSGTIIEVR